jgi:hypothetical protein
MIAMSESPIVGRELYRKIRTFQEHSAINPLLRLALTPDACSSRLDVTQTREATLADHKPWFFVMMPEHADRPGAKWVRSEGVSRGRMVVWPIALEGWIALFVFAATAIAMPLMVWLGMVLPGLMSAPLAMVWTVIVEAILVATFILLVQSRMTSPVAVQRPKRVSDSWDQTFQILW